MAYSILLATAEEERLRKNVILERRQIRASSQPLMLPENAFVGHYRLTKAQFKALCDDLIPLMADNIRINAVPPELRILAAVAFYANGCYQKNIGAFYQLGLSQSSVSKCLSIVTEALNHPSIHRKYINFPRTREEREGVARKFMDNFQFPGVVGCIDGTHVAIIRPSEHEEAYFNRKQFHSINVMIVCDANMQILYVDASFGGASHDSHIWKNSILNSHMQEINASGEACWLLGDSGYAQKRWMMTPILGAAPNSPEEHYTSSHMRTRNVVERCIGVLKTRWRCLLAHRVMHYSPVKAGKITNACVVLHNLINDSRTSIADEELREDNNMQPSQLIRHQQNIEDGREAVVERLWTNRQAIANITQ